MRLKPSLVERTRPSGTSFPLAQCLARYVSVNCGSGMLLMGHSSNAQRAHVDLLK